MDQHLIESLDYDQHFEEVEIDAGKEVERLKGVTFQQALDRLQERLNEMAESNFYKSITVHFGAKSKQPLSYLEEHYERREELLRLELEKEKEYLRKIVEARDEDELNIREQEHRLHHLVVQKRRQEVRDPQDFIPCLYVEAVKKNWLYGSINQAFDKNGMGNFSAKLGYRSPFKKYDSLEFNFERPITAGFKVRYYQAGLEWSNPLRGLGNFYVHLKSAQEYTYKGIDNKLASVGCALQKGNDKYEVDLSFRRPCIREEVATHVLRNFYLPSRKFSLKHSRIFKNTIKFEDITEGEYSQLKTEAAIPVLGESRFLKMEYHYRRFFDTFKVRNHIDNQLARKFFWKSTLQANICATVIKEFGRDRYVNDVLQSMDVRGFENNRKPTPSYCNLKGSLKFNIHNFPVLQDARIGTFLYAQAGLAFLKANPFRPYLTAATGLGLSFPVGPFAQIELLCNAAQYQSRQLREPINLQVRFGLFD